MFSFFISCDDVQQKRLVCASIMVAHCIKLNDQSLQHAFPIISDTKRIESGRFSDGFGT